MKKNKKSWHYQSVVKNPSKAERAVNPGSKHFQSGMGKPSITAKAVNRESWKYCIVLAVILLLSLIVYLPALKNGFVWDDKLYIVDNNLIKNLSWKGIGAMFGDFSLDIYCPLTFLIHAVLFKIGGLNPVMFHFTSLIFHLVNTALVFWFIKMLCDRWEVAAITALLFGIHPLGVESVAWASAGTNIHCAAFFLGSLIAYLYYLQQRQKRYLFISLLFFILSLLSKAVVVLLPVVLLLTDYYKGRKITINVLLEKVPFLMISFGTGILSFLLKNKTGLVGDLAVFNFPTRAVFASYGFITYIFKLLFPFNLSAFYPYPVSGIPYQYYIYPVLLIVLAGYVIYSIWSARSARPSHSARMNRSDGSGRMNRSARMIWSDGFSKKIIFGIGFFTVSIFLVLQLLPVGGAIMADRYTYIPFIGLFYLAGEGLTTLLREKLKLAAIILLSAFTVLFSVKSYARCSVWNNDIALWNDVISHYKSAIAYYNRGFAFMNKKSYDEALKDYNKAIELTPNYMVAYLGRGNLFLNEKRNDEALKDYNKAIELRPGYADIYLSRGTLFIYENRNDEALKDFNKAIELKPVYAQAYYNRGLLEYNSDNKDAAITDVKKAAALGLQPAIDLLNQIGK